MGFGLGKAKRDKKKETHESYKLKKYVFTEPFTVFTVIGSNVNKVKKVAETKALFYFNTKDFYYTLKKIDKQKWLVYCATNTTWDDKELIKGIDGKYPLIMHLKEGKYGIRGKRAVYNIEVEKDGIVIKILNFIMEGYKEPTNDDLLPPTYKLIWSLKGKNFGTNILYLIVVNVLSVFLFLSSVTMVKTSSNELHQALAKPFNIQHRIVSESVRSNVSDVFGLINRIANKIQGEFYISKFNFNQKGEATFRFVCLREKCLSPFPSAIYDPKTNEYVYYYKVGGKR